ncbi:hypothetical protein [Antrihabitans cavernicola]|uniref:Uncharacterized protein n=1 Tax=Antrihabitans cavernicola TaxID=2495913 RepID=A0A5A7S778_9NOCA|nr:hypothetical protein [Spelaeibacter cavernicola]KAA0021029.1 hypothetical protein FOY51_20590 [Spelaeibacter cavernicola]
MPNMGKHKKMTIGGAVVALAAAPLLALVGPGSASALVQGGTATITATGNAVHGDFQSVTTSSGADANCWLHTDQPGSADSAVSPAQGGQASVDWFQGNGGHTYVAYCSDPGDMGALPTFMGQKVVTLPAGPAGPAAPDPAKPPWCAFIPTGSAGC